MRRLGFCIGIIIALAMILFGLQRIPALRFLSDPVIRLTLPVSRMLSRGLSGLTGGWYAVTHAGQISSELADQRARANQLSVQVADLQTIAIENETLKKQLNFLEESKLPFAAVSILGIINDDGRSVVTLDRGSEAGIKTGMPLIIGNGIFVGKIIKADGRRSFALVSTANHSRIAVSLAKIPGTKGVATGNKNLSMTIDYVPADVAMASGDIVVTSGLEPLLPRGLVVGTVDKLLPPATALFQRAYLTVPYALSELQYASVILTP